MAKKHMSALKEAYLIGDMTNQYNFDWNTPSEVMSKVKEEVKELKAELPKRSLIPKNKKGLKGRQVEELGDVLFSVVQLARHLNIDPEKALAQTNIKFMNRFEQMIQFSELPLKEFKTLDIKKKSRFWKQAKKLEKLNRK